jgi:hypothetical protein
MTRLGLPRVAGAEIRPTAYPEMRGNLAQALAASYDDGFECVVESSPGTPRHTPHATRHPPP